MRTDKRIKTKLLSVWLSLSLVLILSLPGKGEDEVAKKSAFSYELALPGRKLTFPADHYSHPNFKTEWWYYTGHLQTDSGKRYGYQVTFFRFGLRDRQNQVKDKPLFSELYMAHFALSDIGAKKFYYRERINRGFNDKAGAATDRYLVWNEDWRVAGDAKNHSIQVKDRGTRLTLDLTALKPPVLHGDDGLSQKGEGEGHASYYYSLTRMESRGALTIDGKTEKVHGSSWMDHEFGSNQLRSDQVGWDWFSIQLDKQYRAHALPHAPQRRLGGPVLQWHARGCEGESHTSRPEGLSGRSIGALEECQERGGVSDEMEDHDSGGKHRAGDNPGVSRAGAHHEPQHAGDLLGRVLCESTGRWDKSRLPERATLR